jgi:hypothetical protein
MSSPTSRAGTGADAAATVAQAVGQRAGLSFLAARIAARSLADRDEVVLAEDSSWLGALDDVLLGVFRTDLRDSVKDPAERRRAIVLVRAVAFAFGPGISCRGIWPADDACGGRRRRLLLETVAGQIACVLSGTSQRVPYLTLQSGEPATGSLDCCLSRSQALRLRYDGSFWDARMARSQRTTLTRCSTG